MNFLLFIREIAIASPKASIAVVEVVGAKLRGHASFKLDISIQAVDTFFNLELDFPVIIISKECNAFRK